jgi:glycosyltransferase involved in cell wall biosynthesis
VIVPSAFARERLRALGAPLAWERVVVLAPPVRALAGTGARSDGQRAAGEGASAGSGAGPGAYALVVSRLAPEKGIEVAIDACRLAGIGLVVAGEGPHERALREHAGDGEVRFAGRVDDAELARLRAGAALALAPSRSAETFALAAAEAMAAGLPVAASRVGALPELVEEEGLVEPGDAHALARAIGRLAGDRAAGERSLARVSAVCSPELVARTLADVYEGAHAPAA